jgi:uncharacterized protein
MAEDEGSLARRLGRALRKRWRSWLRGWHRDVGYLVIGLTFVYAVSGLAINHVGDFDPNYKVVERTHRVPLEKEPRDDEEAAARVVLAALDIAEEPRDFLLEDDGQLEIFFDRRTLLADLDAGVVIDQRERPRFFLRVANWLHYNRGKAAWTFIADGYAILLLFLATSGIFMLRGRKGFWGRGAILIAIGVSVPALYVHCSGGPGG